MNEHCCILCKGNNAQMFKIDYGNKTEYIHIYCVLYSSNVFINPPPLTQCNDNDLDLDDIHKLAILNWDANRTIKNDTTMELLPNYFMNINTAIDKSKNNKCCSLGCSNNMNYASLKCARKICNNHYHIPCAIELCEQPDNVGNFLFHGRMISRKGDNKVLVDRAFICHSHLSWRKDEDWKQISKFINENPYVKHNSFSVDIDLFPLHLRKILMTILELEIYDINLDSNLVNTNQNVNDDDDTTLIDVYNSKRTFHNSDIISWKWKYLHLEEYNKLEHVCKKTENIEVKDTTDILNDSELIEIEQQIDEINEINHDVVVKAVSKSKKLLVEKEIFCTVCGEISLNIPDNLLQCIECDVNVHKSCIEQSYREICGVDIDSNSNFKCVSCIKMNDKKCCLCMCDDDNALYMLPTTRECSFWAHCICIYAHQQSKLILCSEKQSCIVCRDSDIAGANNFQLMKCCGEKCKNLFHPACAWVEGYEFCPSRIVRNDLVDGILIDPIELKAFCEVCMNKRNSLIRKRVHDDDVEVVSETTDDSLLEVEEEVLVFDKYAEPITPVTLTEWDGIVLKHIIDRIEVSSELEVSQGDKGVMKELDAIKGIVKWEKVIRSQTFLHEQVLRGMEKYGTDENVVLLKLSNIDSGLRECLNNCWALSTTKIPTYKYFLLISQNHLHNISALSNTSFDSSDTDIYMIGIKQYKEDKVFEVIDDRRSTTKVIQPEIENGKNEKIKLKQKIPIEEFDRQAQTASKILKKIPDLIVEDEAIKPAQPYGVITENGSMSKFVRSLIEQPVEQLVDNAIEEQDGNCTPLYDDQLDDCNSSVFENEDLYDPEEENNSNPEVSLQLEQVTEPIVSMDIEQVTEPRAIMTISDFRNIFYYFVCSLPNKKCLLTKAKDWFKEMQGEHYDNTKTLKELLDIDKNLSKDGRFLHKNNFLSGEEYVEGYITIVDTDEQSSVPTSNLEQQRTFNGNSMNSGHSMSESSKFREPVQEKRLSGDRDFDNNRKGGKVENNSVPRAGDDRGSKGNVDHKSRDSSYSRSRDHDRSYSNDRDRDRGSKGRKRDRSYSNDKERDRERERNRSYSNDSRKKSTSINSNKHCKFYGTSAGCRKGNSCPFIHARDDKDNRDISKSKTSSDDGKADGKADEVRIESRLSSLGTGLSNLPAWMTCNTK